MTNARQTAFTITSVFPKAPPIEQSLTPPRLPLFEIYQPHSDHTFLLGVGTTSHLGFGNLMKY
ncbi:MAG: hypothetical protein OEY91_07305 [Nitrospirota bacterium]|nr:hypothetical protein [Nitrospirota bacterium]